MPKKWTKEQIAAWSHNPDHVGIMLAQFNDELIALRKSVANRLTHSDGDHIIEIVGKALGKVDRKIGDTGSDLFESVTLALFDQKLAEMRKLATAQKFEKAVVK